MIKRRASRAIGMAKSNTTTAVREISISTRIFRPIDKPLADVRVEYSVDVRFEIRRFSASQRSYVISARLIFVAIPIAGYAGDDERY
jgi:hypothetical protein